MSQSEVDRARAELVKVYQRCVEEQQRCEHKHCVGGRAAAINLKQFVEDLINNLKP